MRLGIPWLAIVLAAGAAQAQSCDPAVLFGAPMSYPATAADAATIVHADFDGDGITDVATESNTGAGFVSVLLGDGGGGFGAPTLFATNQARPYGLSKGDVNADGFVDLACGNAEGPNIAVLLGNGDGTFQPIASVGLAVARAIETALVDMDGDGVLDLVASDDLADRLWLLRGNGDGTFSGGAPIPAGDSPSFFSVGDADADGHLDLLVAN